MAAGVYWCSLVPACPVEHPTSGGVGLCKPLALGRSPLLHASLCAEKRARCWQGCTLLPSWKEYASERQASQAICYTKMLAILACCPWHHTHSGDALWPLIKILSHCLPFAMFAGSADETVIGAAEDTFGRTLSFCRAPLLEAASCPAKLRHDGATCCCCDWPITAVSCIATI